MDNISQLNNIQHQVLIGGLLGDMHMSMNGNFPRIKIDRQYLDRPYLEWQFNIFKDFCKSPIKDIIRYDKRYDKEHKYCSFRTRVVPAFLSYYKQWYISGKKIVPQNIELTPLIMAVWFADDGCIINENNDCLVIKLSTDSFGEAGTQLLSSKLEELYNVKFPIYRKVKDKDLFFIKASTTPAKLFIKDIEKHILEMNMQRKYNCWKDVDLENKIKIGRKPNPLIKS